jgi:malonyl-CoA/methylmalonyl-CoA synthetase
MHPERTALVEPGGAVSYAALDAASRRIATGLLRGNADLAERRIAFLVPPGSRYVSVQWGIWRAGGVAVPLALSHPPAEWEHVLRDAAPTLLVTSADSAPRIDATAARAGIEVITTSALDRARPGPLPVIAPERRALMVYSSGTTGRPKGVVTTHANLAAQIRSLVSAWEWTPADRILLVLPLHHVHGIVNVVGCALWAGATCEIPRAAAADPPRPFDAEETWEHLASGTLTLFMAVPTIYRRLIAAWDASPAERREVWSSGCRSLRLMVSGSAALPVPVLERWRAISGHVLLERYGMTEIGMALANPLRAARRPGFVGTPLPGVEVRLVNESGAEVPASVPGEIEVRGPTVFLEYWRQPEATRRAFREGWFRTGDLAVVEEGSYRILGRSSVDIIKSGGYKVSALEIEEVLRTHPAVAECAVVGVPDQEWDERVAAAVELAPGATLSLEELVLWTRERLAPYKVPRLLRCVPVLPRNVMGKVVKPEIVAWFQPR